MDNTGKRRHYAHSEAFSLVLDDDGDDEDYEFDDDFDLNTCSDEEEDSNDDSEYADIHVRKNCQWLAVNPDHDSDLSQATDNSSWGQANNKAP